MIILTENGAQRSKSIVEFQQLMRQYAQAALNQSIKQQRYFGMLTKTCAQIQ
jgi:hypothetical protein